MNPQRTTRRPRLTHKADKILRALLEHPTQEKAAAAAGVSTTTVWRYQQKPRFRRALAEARREIFSQATARLQQASSAAASTLARVMVDNTTPAASKIRAAACVLEFATRGTQLEDVEVRLLELERSASRPVAQLLPRQARSANAGTSTDSKKAA